MIKFSLSETKVAAHLSPIKPPCKSFCPFFYATTVSSHMNANTSNICRDEEGNYNSECHKDSSCNQATTDSLPTVSILPILCVRATAKLRLINH